MNHQKIIKQQFYQNKQSWINSSREGISIDGDRCHIPWYSYGAIEFLKQNLTKNDIIFEFGCGSSTIFYQQRVKKIVSIETNQVWFKIIFDYLKKSCHQANIFNNLIKFNNCEVYLMTDGLNNDFYQKFAYDYSQRNNIFFDYIIVDSIKRYQCSTYSINALNDKGILILDDSERLNYQKIFDFYQHNNFNIKNFYGIAHNQLRTKNTTFFQRN